MTAGQQDTCGRGTRFGKTPSPVPLAQLQAEAGLAWAPSSLAESTPRHTETQTVHAKKEKPHNAQNAPAQLVEQSLGICHLGSSRDSQSCGSPRRAQSRLSLALSSERHLELPVLSVLARAARGAKPGPWPRPPSPEPSSPRRRNRIRRSSAEKALRTQRLSEDFFSKAGPRLEGAEGARTSGSS